MVLTATFYDKSRFSTSNRNFFFLQCGRTAHLMMCEDNLGRYYLVQLSRGGRWGSNVVRVGLVSGITATVVHQAGNACSGVKRSECEGWRILETLPPSHHHLIAGTNLLSKKIANGGTPWLIARAFSRHTLLSECRKILRGAPEYHFVSGYKQSTALHVLFSRNWFHRNRTV